MAQSMQILDANDFYKTSNSIIYEKMITLFENNHTIDYISIIEELKKD